MLAAQQPSFMLTAGDNSYLVAAAGPARPQHLRPLHDAMANAPLWATLGEHDLFLDGGRTIISALHLPGDGKHYSVRYGPIQVVALGLQADAKALAYARRALAEPGPSVRFILVHRPIRAGNPILPLLRSRHVAAILAGPPAPLRARGRGRRARVHGRDERRGRRATRATRDGAPAPRSRCWTTGCCAPTSPRPESRMRSSTSRAACSIAQGGRSHRDGACPIGAPSARTEPPPVDERAVLRRLRARP